MGEFKSDTGVRVFSRWIFNCYVVVGDGGLPVVVDPGIPSTASRAAHFLQAQGASELHSLSSAKPVSVMATHGHSDHVGGLAALCQTLGSDRRVELHLPIRDRDYLAGEKPRTPTMKEASRILPVLRDAEFSGRAFVEFVAGGRKAGFGVRSEFTVPIPPTSFLGDGDPVPGAEDWVVIATPGHTDDSVSFYNESMQTLLSGDAVLSVGGRAWFTPEFIDGGLMAATEQRLRALRVDHLYPGHGHAVHGTDVLREAIPHMARP